MNTVAILAVILGPAVGALGVVFGFLQSRGERAQSLALARVQQDHALALAEGQHEHEHRLQAGDRLFAKRGDLYVRLLEFLDRQLLRVERTNPIMTFGAAQEPPESEDEAETARMQAEVRVYGSAEVWRMIVDLSGEVRAFYVASSLLDMVRSRRTPETMTHWEDVQKHREIVRASTDKVCERVQQEVETL
jgi:hypothetical protein